MMAFKKMRGRFENGSKVTCHKCQRNGKGRIEKGKVQFTPHSIKMSNKSGRRIKGESEIYIQSPQQKSDGDD